MRFVKYFRNNTLASYLCYWAIYRERPGRKLTANSLIDLGQANQFDEFGGIPITSEALYRSIYLYFLQKHSKLDFKEL